VWKKSIAAEPLRGLAWSNRLRLAQPSKKFDRARSLVHLFVAIVSFPLTISILQLVSLPDVMECNHSRFLILCHFTWDPSVSTCHNSLSENRSHTVQLSASTLLYPEYNLAHLMTSYHHSRNLNLEYLNSNSIVSSSSLFFSMSIPEVSIVPCPPASSLLPSPPAPSFFS
jgi:hypothetical protein